MFVVVEDSVVGSVSVAVEDSTVSRGVGSVFGIVEDSTV